MRTITGTLLLHVGDLAVADAPSEHYELEVEGGDRFKVTFESEEQAHATPLNRLISLSADVSSGDIFIPRMDTWYSLIGPEPDLYIPQVFRIGVFKCLRPDQIDQMEKYQRQVDAFASGVEDAWQTVSRRYRDYDVRGFVLVTENVPGRGEYLIDESVTLLEELGTDWRPHIYHAWGGASASYCGWGTVGGNGSMTYVQCTGDTGKHETGHNRGLMHSRTIDFNFQKIHEYGDGSCFMGNSRQADGINAVQRSRLGLESERETLRLTASRRVLLAPVELDIHAQLPEEVQTVVVDVDGIPDVYISKRESTDLVYLHMLQNRYSGLLATLINPGQSVEVAPGKLSVELVDLHNNQAIVGVNVNGAPATNVVTFPDERFPPLIPGAEPRSVHSGSWADPTIFGQGFDVFIKPSGQLMYFWYCYRDKRLNGAKTYPKRFFYGHAEAGEEATVLRSELPPGADKYQEHDAGTIRFQFFDGENGVVQYDLKDHGRGSIQIKKLFGSNDPRSGVFYDPENPGRGATIQVSGRLISALLYQYGPPQRSYSLQPFPDSTQRWINLSGENDGIPDSFSGDVWEHDGGKFRAEYKTQERAVGSCLIHFDGADAVVIQYETPETGPITLDYTRLF